MNHRNAINHSPPRNYLTYLLFNVIIFILVDKKLCKNAYIAGVAKASHSLISVAHVTGHLAAGMGATFKNIGMVNDHTEKDYFRSIWLKIDHTVQLEHAHEIGLGNLEYDLQTLQ